MTNNSLQNIENYKKTFSNTSTEIYAKYLGLIQEYMTQCVESIYIKNKFYNEYVIYKGIETISHVFHLLLLYTKNIELTYHHCQKSFYYYVEFMGQVVNENHSFLQLNAKDASLFVYKKTIFDINNEYIKQFEEFEANTKIIENVDLLITIYNRSLLRLIHKHEFLSNDKHSITKKMGDFHSKISQNLLNIKLICNENEYFDKLSIVNEFDKNLLCDNTEIDLSLYVELFVRKLKKSSIDIEKMRLQLLHEGNNNKFKALAPPRYINWILQL